MRHVLDKVSWWHFQSTSKKVIWSKNIKVITTFIVFKVIYQIEIDKIYSLQ